MSPEFEHIVASDGYRLFARHWRPSGVPRGFVVALHGIQSHSGWYEYSSSRLCEAGYDVLFLDRRGSGRNFSRRGDVSHGDRLINDVLQVLSDVRRERDRVAPSAPIVLLAVSWGGKLAAITAARSQLRFTPPGLSRRFIGLGTTEDSDRSRRAKANEPPGQAQWGETQHAAQRLELVDGLALLYPGLCSRVQPTAWQRARLNLARQLDVRHKRVEIPLNDPALFTAESRWQEFIRNDPLVLREVTSGFLLAHQDLTHESLAAAPQIHCPTLLMLAGRDQIIDNEATKSWARQLGTRELTLCEYPEAQHTLEFEPQPDRFVNDLVAWLQSIGDRA